LGQASPDHGGSAVVRRLRAKGLQALPGDKPEAAPGWEVVDMGDGVWLHRTEIVAGEFERPAGETERKRDAA
jgi:hypothetical protein